MPIRWTAALLSLLLVVAATGADRGSPAASAASAAQWTSGGPYADDATAVAASPGFDADGIAFMGTSQQIEAHQPDVQGVAAILRSTDGGLTWTTAYSRASTPGTNKEWLTQIVASPAFATDRTVFATWSEGQSGGVLRSTDGGATWTSLVGPTSTLGHDQLAGASSPAGQQYDFSFAGPSTVYAVHDWAKAQPRIYRSTDAGATWSVFWRQNGVSVVHDAAAAGASTLFLADGNLGLIRSTDLARTRRSVGSFEPALHGLAISPADATDATVFAVSYPSGLPTVGQDTPAYGIYRSTDGGASWHEPEAPNPAVGDIFTTAANGGLSLAVSPDFAADGTVFEGDNLGAVSISHDRGETWTTSLLGSPPQAGWYVFGLQPSPGFRTDHTVYLGLGNQGFGVAKSRDGGQTWFSDVPIDRSGEIADDFVRDLAVSQEPSGVVDLAIGLGITGLILAEDTPAATTAPQWIGMNYANTAAVTMSPDYQHDCTAFVAGLSGTLDEGVYRSTDACTAGGSGPVQWQRVTGSLPVRDFQAVALSPGFAGDRSLVIGSATGGVWLSRSAGLSWSALSDGLGNLDVHKLALAPTGALVAATDAGVWRTAIALVPSPPTARTFLPLAQKRG